MSSNGGVGGKGPDRVKEAANWSTWSRDGAVKIKHLEDKDKKAQAGSGRVPAKPTSVPTWIKKCCGEFGNLPAYGVKGADGKWTLTSYKDYYKQMRTVARAFIKLGLEPYHSVTVSGFNSPEWCLSALGAILAGGFSTGLYPTNSAEMNKYIMNDSGANIFVVEDHATLKKMLPVMDEIPSVKKIIQYTGEPSHPGVMSWKELMELGSSEKGEDADADLNERLSNMYVNQCCCLIYTSGTTGNPKGVMLSHDNVVFTAMTVVDLLKLDKERVISYLPLSHIAGLMVDVFGLIGGGGTSYFADKSALKGTLLTYLQDVRPTLFFGVPRVWEKIQEGMIAKGREIKGLKKKVSTACKQAGLDHHTKRKDGFMYTVGQKVIYKAVREALGLDQCRIFYSAAAPISKETLEYFLSLDIVISQLFGMSETTGPHTISVDPTSFGEGSKVPRIMSVGPTMPGVKTKLHNINSEGDGEICMWGRNIMMGYLNREDKTTDDIDDEGWMHSGDLASVDKDGYVYITGRLKELLITAGGENVAPVPIEDCIKKELPAISNVVLIGDSQKYLSAFLTFKVVMDAKTDEPTKQLLPATIDWCQSFGRNNIKTVDDILKGPDPVIMSAIQAGIDRANAQAVSNASRVQKWTVIPTDLSIPGGELGPTLKLKRFTINKKFAHAVDNLYV